MRRIYERLTMKHLMWVAMSFVALGLVWIGIVLASSMDSIWVIPGIFLVISGIVKIVAVQIWIRVAKLGTDEHKPIKAL